MNWVLYAVLSALFAGITAIFAKLGVENIPSNLATLIRTIVVVIFAFIIVFNEGHLSKVSSIPGRSWLFLVVSGLATGVSWLFYFAALKSGPISGVAPIDKLSFLVAILLGVLFLGEKLTKFSIAGVALIAIGVLLTIPAVQQRLH